jgi:L-asparaginase II
VPAARSSSRAAAAPSARAVRRTGTRSTPPILVRHVRGAIVESTHRGDVVEADAAGEIIRALGDPERVVSLRSCVKPLGAALIVEAADAAGFELEPAEIAIMASSHSGEDLHVRTLQALYRRAGISQAGLACGTAGAPLDLITAARLARDGEVPGAIRHMCSGQHSVFLLLCKLEGIDPTGYWRDDHVAQVRYRQTVARAFATRPDRLVTAIDGCGIPTYAFPLREVARAYAMLADPGGLAASDPRRSLAPALTRVRDAMAAHPEMVGGNHDRIDTSLMKAAPGRLVAKGGMEALRGVAILAGRPGDGPVAKPRPASGMAIKIEDGDGYDRATWAATVEALAQAGVLDAAALRQLARYHRPPTMDPHGRVGAESIADFQLVPLGELV